MQFLARATLPARDGPFLTAADGATVTFDCARADKHLVVLGGNRTLALSGDADGQAVTVVLSQDATGGRTVTWWAGIFWGGGVAPTLSTAPWAMDTFTFFRLSAETYLGFFAGSTAATTTPIIGCQLSGAQTLSVSAATWTAVPFGSGTEVFDTHGYHDTSTNNTRVTVPAGMGGKYQVSGVLSWTASAAGGARGAGLRVNGSTFHETTQTNGISSVVHPVSVAGLVPLAAGDYVELVGWQQSGGALALTGTAKLTAEFRGG